VCVCVCVCVVVCFSFAGAIILFYTYVLHVYELDEGERKKNIILYVYRKVYGATSGFLAYVRSRVCAYINYSRTYRICVYTVYYNPVCKLR